MTGLLFDETIPFSKVSMGVYVNAQGGNSDQISQFLACVFTLMQFCHG